MLRPLLWLAVVLAAIVMAAPLYLPGADRPEIAGYNWRRTVSGWERLPEWRVPESGREPALHPVSLASLQLAFSLLVLSAGSDPTDDKPH
jgi:hypothetical protein